MKQAPSFVYVVGFTFAGAVTLSCASEETGPTSNQQSESLSCTPNMPQACPCAGGGVGTQQCAASGDAYLPCTGCPAPAAGNTSIAEPGATSGQLELGSTVIETGGEGPPLTDAGTRTNSSLPDDTRGGSDGGSSLGEQGPTIGTSCGVGLPRTCAIGTEKCCVRSLATDSCIESGASCECDAKDCITLEAHCDGPEDCDTGQVCCGTLSGSSYSEFSCQSDCRYNGTQRIACHQVEPDCPSGTVCSNSQLLTNLQVCIDPSSIEQ